MNAFIHILQKEIRTQKVINPYQELKTVHLKDTNELLFNIVPTINPNIWNNYYKNEINKDKDHTIYWVYHYMNSLFYNIDNQTDTSLIF